MVYSNYIGPGNEEVRLCSEKEEGKYNPEEWEMNEYDRKVLEDIRNGMKGMSEVYSQKLSPHSKTRKKLIGGLAGVFVAFALTEYSDPFTDDNKIILDNNVKSEVPHAIEYVAKDNKNPPPINIKNNNGYVVAINVKGDSCDNYNSTHIPVKIMTREEYDVFCSVYDLQNMAKGKYNINIKDSSEVKCKILQIQRSGNGNTSLETTKEGISAICLNEGLGFNPNDSVYHDMKGPVEIVRIYNLDDTYEDYVVLYTNEAGYPVENCTL